MGKKVGILTTNFSPDGTRMIYGGAEEDMVLNLPDYY